MIGPSSGFNASKVVKSYIFEFLGAIIMAFFKEDGMICKDTSARNIAFERYLEV